MTLSPRSRKRSRSPKRADRSSRKEEKSGEARTWKHLSANSKQIKREVSSRSPSPSDVRSRQNDSRDVAFKKPKTEPMSQRSSDRIAPSSSMTSSASRSKKDPKVKKEKKKKSKTRRRSSSSSDSSTSDLDDGKIQQKLEEQRLRLKEEKRLEKERMKAQETPEEKRARRLAKKLAKENKKKANLGWDEEHMNYSNLDNPFNDSKLTETFLWKKKIEKEGLTKVPISQVEQINKQRVLENKAELDKAYQRRLEREAQREEIEMMRREREAQQFKEWETMEDQFHLQQSRLRSEIRIKERRAKAIDLLARYISAAEEDETEELDIEMHEPYHYLNGLSIRDLEDLLEDIRVYRSLEKGKNEDYWKDITVIACLGRGGSIGITEMTLSEEELSKLRKFENPAESGADRREGIHGSVKKDVSSILKGKNHQQLALLETEILRKIKGQQEGVDVGYWESLLGHLKAHMARARLRDRHQDALKRKLKKLKQEQGMKEVKQEEEELEEEETEIASVSNEEPSRPEAEGEEEQKIRPWEQMSAGEREGMMAELYSSGRFSPAYLTDVKLPPGTEIVDPTEDERRLEFARKELKSGGATSSQKDAAFEAEAKKGMGEDERTFSTEMPLEQQTYLWSDKYRPRKPRYFNRVHTGFEWNKYNQTHYDLDNPPPKIVQGYKFNIFFPDLLDPNIAPEFSVIPCEDPDFAVLKFKAGPPYEDIAFKIVNREWEANHKRGYRCQFQNGIFQLWFHFKKYRYRR